MKTRAILLLFMISLSICAQERDRDTSFKNTIRYNFTPMLLTGQTGSFAIGYERVIGKYQTMSVNVGQLKLPGLISTKSGSPVEWIGNIKNKGFIASLDYRFYFKRNKYRAPDGLYWGPYAVHYYTDNLSRISLIENDVVSGGADLKTNLNLTMVGLQLGYQFVLWNRFTLDLIFIAPSIGFYNTQFGIQAYGEIKVDDEDFQAVFDAILELFPGASLIFQEHTITRSGRSNFRGPGFRYLIQIGFRF